MAETLSSVVESLIEGPQLELDPSKITAKIDVAQQALILGEKCDQVLQIFQRKKIEMKQQPNAFA